MKLWIVAVGHKMPEWVAVGFEEYRKRMPREAKIELIEIKPEKRDGRTLGQVLEAEKGRIAAAIPAQAERVVLDEHGAPYTTLQLADQLAGWLAQGCDAAFVIGGADGLHPDLKRETRRLWSLSSLTLPHGLVRVVVAEQLYRAHSILQHHPYHRA